MLFHRRLTPSLGLVALVLGATSISLAVIASKQAFAEGADARTILAARLVLAGLLVAPVVFASMRAGSSRLGVAGIVVGICAGATLWLGGRAELEGLARLPAGTLVLVGLPLILALGATTAIWAVTVGIGLQATDAVTAAIVVDLEPVLVAVLAFVLLDEGLSAREIVGGLIVLAALAALAIQARSDAGASASERTARARQEEPRGRLRQM
jgi:drug/metabolite transporter (DMT)-like permease